MNKDKSALHLKTEDTVVVNVAEKNLLMVSFLEAVADDEQNASQAQAGVDKCYTAISEQKLVTPVSVLVDLRPIGNENHISAQAKKVYMSFVADPRIDKVAVLGASDTQVTITNFLLTFTDGIDKKLAWFSNETEAKYWILQ